MLKTLLLFLLTSFILLFPFNSLNAADKTVTVKLAEAKISESKALSAEEIAFLLQIKESLRQEIVEEVRQQFNDKVILITIIISLIGMILSITLNVNYKNRLAVINSKHDSQLIELQKEMASLQKDSELLRNNVELANNTLEKFNDNNKKFIEKHENRIERFMNDNLNVRYNSKEVNVNLNPYDSNDPLSNLNEEDRKHYQFAMDNYHAFKFEEALEGFNNLFRNQVPNLERLHLARVYAAYAFSQSQSENKLTDNAICNYLISIEKDAKNPDTYRNLGDLYWENGELNKACECFEKSTMLFPCAKLFNEIGNFRGALNGQDVALDYYYKALKTDPDYLYTYVNLIETFIYLDDFQKANENFKYLQSKGDNDSDYAFYICFFSIVLACWSDEYHFNLTQAMTEIKNSVGNKPKVIKFRFDELATWLEIRFDDSKGKKFLIELIDDIENWIGINNRRILN